MKQVFRRVIDSKGIVQVRELPAPACGDNQVLIRTHFTAISAGTEGATLSKTFPELVRQTLSDPWMRSAVKNLVFGASPIITKNIVWDETTLMRAIGYSGSGTVLEVGNNVDGFSPGDRVAFAAQGHAEIVAPSQNFTVPVPDNVSLEEASLVTIGGIAMQGVRRAEIQLGESVVVFGLGLVGQITAQLVHAAGGHVIGIDINPQRLADLKKLIPACSTVNSQEVDPVQAIHDLTGGYGGDAVLICAASKEPVIANQAMKMCRKQARVVFVGLVKMDLERMPFFRNELDLRFSRAYGPGVMDPAYESGRVDYPYHYVRWTEQRNLAEVLRLISEKRLNVDHLIAGKFSVDDAQGAYDALYGGQLNGPVALLQYRTDVAADGQPKRKIQQHSPGGGSGKVRVGVIGCGNFTRSTHIPNLSNHPEVEVAAIASSSGTNAVSIVERFKIPYSTTDYHEILNDPAIDAVLIATRHNLHGPIASEALRAGKHVFVEKPAVLNWDQYRELEKAVGDAGRIFCVGYNRRFSPLALKLKGQLNSELPMLINYQVSIPEVPPDHWTLDPVEGGGRLIGEAEHFFDFLNYLTDSEPRRVTAQCITKASESIHSQYNFIVSLDYGNRANATVVYTSYAPPGTPREVITVSQCGRSFSLEDFKKLSVSGQRRIKLFSGFGDMGHRQELNQFILAVRGQTTTMDVANPLAASRISLQALDDLEAGTMATMPATQSGDSSS